MDPAIQIVEARQILRATPRDGGSETIHSLRDTDERILHSLEVLRMRFQNLHDAPQRFLYVAKADVRLVLALLESFQPLQREVDRHLSLELAPSAPTGKKSARSARNSVVVAERREWGHHLEKCHGAALDEEGEDEAEQPRA